MSLLKGLTAVTSRRPLPFLRLSSQFVYLRSDVVVERSGRCFHAASLGHGRSWRHLFRKARPIPGQTVHHCHRRIDCRSLDVFTVHAVDWPIPRAFGEEKERKNMRGSRRRVYTFQ